MGHNGDGQSDPRQYRPLGVPDGLGIPDGGAVVLEVISEELVSVAVGI